MEVVEARVGRHSTGSQVAEKDEKTGRFLPGNLMAKRANHPKRRLTNILRQELQKTDPESGEKYEVIIARRVIEMAKNGLITDPLTLHAFREIADRTEGKAVSTLELSGPDRTPIAHVEITPGMSALEASEIYRRAVGADPADFEAVAVEEAAGEADDLIEQAARRASGGEDAE
jgi:hypothetical protein